MFVKHSRRLYPARSHIVILFAAKESRYKTERNNSVKIALHKKNENHPSVANCQNLEA